MLYNNIVLKIRHLGGICMNSMYGYFVVDNNYDNYPSWIKIENYIFCENFSKILKYFKKR